MERKPVCFEFVEGQEKEPGDKLNCNPLLKPEKAFPSSLPVNTTAVVFTNTHQCACIPSHITATIVTNNRRDHHHQC